MASFSYFVPTGLVCVRQTFFYRYQVPNGTNLEYFLICLVSGDESICTQLNIEGEHNVIY